MTSRNQARRHRGSNRQIPRAKPETSQETSWRHIAPRDHTALKALIYWRQVLDKPLFVYLVQQASGGAVKIGQAHDPIRRVAGLQCGNPEHLRIRVLLLATEEAEDHLHSLWSPVHVRGEWFGGGLEEALLELGRQASAWQVAEHKAHAVKSNELAYWLAAEGCGRVAFPRLAQIRAEETA